MGTLILGCMWICAAIFGMSMGVAMWFDGWKDFLRSL